MSKPALLACFEDAQQTLVKIDQIQTEYRQGREVFNQLNSGQPVAGTLYLQVAEGEPLQLPLPDATTLQAMLAEGSERLRVALHEAWTRMLTTAQKALESVPPAAPPPTPAGG